MSFIDWDGSLAIEIKEIDIQHKYLITLINKLYDHANRKATSEELAGIFKDLISYTKTHFQTEEYYFKQTDYPHAKSHIEEHKFLARTALAKYEKLKNGQTDMDLELLEFLKSWFIFHIKKVDMQYKHFLKSHGIK